MIIRRQIKGDSLCIYITLSSLLFIIVCCVKNPVSSHPANNFFPLKVGNEWTYQFEVPSNDTLETREIKHRIVDRIEIDGEFYFRFDYSMPFMPFKSAMPELDSLKLRESFDGNIKVFIKSKEYSYLPFNGPSVDSLQKLKLGDYDYSFKVKSKADTVEISAGSFFNCMKVLCYFPQIKGTEFYIWFAAGYGPVKIYYPSYGVTYNLVNVTIN